MDDILTPKQTAAMLSVHVDTLRKLPVPSHPLPGTRMRRYLKREVVAWLEASHSTAGKLQLVFRTKL